MSSPSQDPVSTGKPVALFSSQNRSNQEMFSDRIFPSGHQQVLGNSKPLFRFSHPENFVKCQFEGHRGYMLVGATSEIMMQECTVDTLNTCIRELQRQAHSHRLELDGANYCGDE